MSKKVIILTIIAVLLVGIAGYFLFQYRGDIEKQQQPVACTMEAKICSDGSSVGRSGPKCEFTPCPENVGIVYKNNEYGFEITFPNSWKGYTVVKDSWAGWRIDGSDSINDYIGVKFIFKNPQTTAQQKWQDIPVMIFTHDIWQLVQEEKIGVSAAPIGPVEIGENDKYVFATPPRWYGFTDDVGFQEAVEIVKTLKAF